MSEKGRNFDEGLGTVYERFMLNSFFDPLINSHHVEKVLEVPFYGMTGLSGINSVHFAERGCKLAMVDSKKDKVDEAAELWGILPYDGQYEIIYQDDLSKLPFADKSFDLVWNFAALWHVKEAEELLSEMARVSSNLIVIFVPNQRQMGYILRKHLLDREFFEVVDERWVDTEKISSYFIKRGFKIKDIGFLDLPPWPDTCIPVKNILGRMGMGKSQKEEKSEGPWTWDIVSYYLGKNPDLKQKVEKFSFLERKFTPRWFKNLWAHHRYMVFAEN